MPSFEEHCCESERLFGHAYPQVHRWLDEFAGAPGIGMRHRCKRHHLRGIEKCVGLFGPEVREVARSHIVSDLKMEGWSEEDPFPKDEEHYRRLGLF